MKLTTIKTAAEAKIPGIEFVFTDKSITEVVIGKLHIRKGESYSSALQVLVETPFEKAERYSVIGKIDGFPDAVSYFEGEYEAKVAADKLEAKGAEVTVSKVAVQIDEAGNIAAPTDAREVDRETDLVPF